MSSENGIQLVQTGSKPEVLRMLRTPDKTDKMCDRVCIQGLCAAKQQRQIYFRVFSERSIIYPKA